MSFYLLKSDCKRNETGDVLLDTNKISSLSLYELDSKDTDNKIYWVKIEMDNGDARSGMYNTIEAAKKVIKEILGESIQDFDLNDLMPAKT